MESLTDKLAGQGKFQGLQTVPPSLIGAAVIKHHDQNNSSRKGWSGFPILIIVPKWRKPIQEHGDRNWRRHHREGSSAYWLVFHGFIILLSSTTQDHCPGVLSPHIGDWALPHQLLIPEMLHRFVYGPIQWRHCLTWGKLFLDDSNLHQVEKKNDQNRQSWWIRTFSNKWKKQKTTNVISFTACELEFRWEKGEKQRGSLVPAPAPCVQSESLLPVIHLQMLCHSWLKILRHCRKLGGKLFSPKRQSKAVTRMVITQKQMLAWKIFCLCLSPHFTLGHQGFLQVTGGQTWHHHPERRLVMDITFC